MKQRAEKVEKLKDRASALKKEIKKEKKEGKKNRGEMGNPQKGGSFGNRKSPKTNEPRPEKDLAHARFRFCCFFVAFLCWLFSFWASEFELWVWVLAFAR